VLDETIVAIATAAGAAGLAVVRASGTRAIEITDRVFRGRACLAGAPSHTLHHGWAVWPEGPCVPGANGSDGEPGDGGGPAAARPGAESTRPGPDPPRAPEPRRLDEVVVALFRAPRSYTREDVVEISCHGGRISAGRVLAALLRAGARLARPGEFTLRAFVNGRIDLAQAEAVADLIRAETEAAHELALSQIAGELSRRLDELSERVTDSLGEVEARVDFAEDVGGVEVPPHVVSAIRSASAELDTLLGGAAFARAVREGVRLPLVGRPNVGKSALFNALIGEERAIVTDLPGTTRDRVSEAIELNGVRVTLSDTAGLRAPSEPVEAIGIARAEQALDQSRVVVWVVDGAAPLEPEDLRVASRLDEKRVLVALNKRGLGPVTRAAEVEPLLDGASRRRIVAVSATQREGLDEARQALVELLELDRSEGLGGAVSNPRHVEALSRARESLARAAAAGCSGAPGEIVALELREALEAIGEVTGRTVGEDLLDRIFSRFCVGK